MSRSSMGNFEQGVDVTRNNGKLAGRSRVDGEPYRNSRQLQATQSRLHGALRLLCYTAKTPVPIN